MPNWFDQITPQFIRNVANKLMFDGGLEAFNVFPSLTTQSLTGYIADYNKADWAKIGKVEDYILAGASESRGDDFGVGKLPYVLRKFGFHKDVSEDEANEFDNPFDPVRDAAEFVIHRLRRVMLSLALTSFYSTGIWSTDIDITSAKWNATSSGSSANDPTVAVSAAQDAVAKTTGLRPNRMIVTPDVHKALKENTFIKNSIKTTSDKVVTTGLLKSLFEVDTYTVLGAVNESATDWMSKGKVLLIYTPDRPSRTTPSAGYFMNLRRAADNGKPGDMVQTRRIPMLHLNNSLRIEGYVHAQPLKVAGDLGVFMYNVV